MGLKTLRCVAVLICCASVAAAAEKPIKLTDAPAAHFDAAALAAVPVPESRGAVLLFPAASELRLYPKLFDGSIDGVRAAKLPGFATVLLTYADGGRTHYLVYVPSSNKVLDFGPDLAPAGEVALGTTNGPAALAVRPGERPMLLVRDEAKPTELRAIDLRAKKPLAPIPFVALGENERSIPTPFVVDSTGQRLFAGGHLASRFAPAPVGGGEELRQTASHTPNGGFVVERSGARVAMGGSIYDADFDAVVARPPSYFGDIRLFLDGRALAVADRGQEFSFVDTNQETLRPLVRIEGLKPTLDRTLRSEDVDYPTRPMFLSDGSAKAAARAVLVVSAEAWMVVDLATLDLPADPNLRFAIDGPAEAMAGVRSTWRVRADPGVEVTPVEKPTGATLAADGVLTWTPDAPSVKTLVFESKAKPGAKSPATAIRPAPGATAIRPAPAVTATDPKPGAGAIGAKPGARAAAPASRPGAAGVGRATAATRPRPGTAAAEAKAAPVVATDATPSAAPVTSLRQSRTVFVSAPFVELGFAPELIAAGGSDGNAVVAASLPVSFGPTPAIATIDRKTLATVARRVVEAQQYRPPIATDGKHVFVALAKKDAIDVLDFKTLAPVSQILMPAHVERLEVKGGALLASASRNNPLDASGIDLVARVDLGSLALQPVTEAEVRAAAFDSMVGRDAAGRIVGLPDVRDFASPPSGGGERNDQMPQPFDTGLAAAFGALERRGGQRIGELKRTSSELQLNDEYRRVALAPAGVPLVARLDSESSVIPTAASGAALPPRPGSSRAMRPGPDAPAARTWSIRIWDFDAVERPAIPLLVGPQAFRADAYAPKLVACGPDSLAAVVGTRIQFVTLDSLSKGPAPLPTPLHFVRDPDPLVVPRSGQAKLAVSVAGGKPPYRFEPSFETPYVKVDAKTGAVDLDIDAVVAAMKQSRIGQYYRAPNAQKSAAFFRFVAGADAVGLPTALPIPVRVTDADGRTVSRTLHVLFDGPGDGAPKPPGQTN